MTYMIIHRNIFLIDRFVYRNFLKTFVIKYMFFALEAEHKIRSACNKWKPIRWHPLALYAIWWAPIWSCYNFIWCLEWKFVCKGSCLAYCSHFVTLLVTIWFFTTNVGCVVCLSVRLCEQKIWQSSWKASRSQQCFFISSVAELWWGRKKVYSVGLFSKEIEGVSFF